MWSDLSRRRLRDIFIGLLLLCLLVWRGWHDPRLWQIAHDPQWWIILAVLGLSALLMSRKSCRNFVSSRLAAFVFAGVASITLALAWMVFCLFEYGFSGMPPYGLPSREVAMSLFLWPFFFGILLVTVAFLLRWSGSGKGN
jgi:hypothetical protein